MGILCCFSAPATADEDEKPVIDVRSKDVADAEARRASGALAAIIVAQAEREMRVRARVWTLARAMARDLNIDRSSGAI